ncbi:MAG TPA: hypothetical protein VNA25_29005, partial [Phycisphaerae bacterium]|nr:hypothetical protein [Phycisphaerae bacterium]
MPDTACEIGERANLSDAELIARAESAGWEWSECHPRPYRTTLSGWKRGEGSYICCDVGRKADVLRGNFNVSGTHLGFDHAYDCSECGKPIWLCWVRMCEQALLDRRECFNCNHWLDQMRGHGPRDIIAVDSNGAHT